MRSRSATMNDADATKSPIQRVLALCAEMRKVGRDPHERNLIGALHRWENGERHDRIGEQAIVRLTPPWQR